MDREPHPIITALRQTRLELGLSQRALAERAGVPQAHISRIERGLVEPRLSMLLELARLLRLEPMLVPVQRIALVEALLRGEDPADTPLYPPDGDGDWEDEG